MNGKLWKGFALYNTDKNRDEITFLMVHTFMLDLKEKNTFLTKMACSLTHLFLADAVYGLCFAPETESVLH